MITPASVPDIVVSASYQSSRYDHALNPDLERFHDKRMGAKTSEISASHVAFISHPKVVARLIEQAATATAK